MKVSEITSAESFGYMVFIQAAVKDPGIESLLMYLLLTSKDPGFQHNLINPDADITEQPWRNHE
jgi:hypothetical protein